MFGFLWSVVVYSFFFVYYILKLLCFLVLILLLLLWKHQGAILYQRHAPSRKRQLAYNPFPRVRTPAYYKLDFDDFFITTKDRVSIHCWLIRQPNPTECATVVCFHGNAGNIGYRLPNAYFMYRELQCNVVMMDYRGYGNSEGVPTERGLSYDAESVLAHLLERNDINLNKIYLFGRSLGGAVAIDLAYRCCTRKLVSLSNDQVVVNANKMTQGQTTAEASVAPDASTNEHSPSSTQKDDELAHLTSNAQSVTDRKIFIAGLIVENTFTSILDMVFVIIDEFLKSRQSNQEHHGHQPLSTCDDDEDDAENEESANSEATYGGGKLAKFLKCLRFFLRYFITNNWDSAAKVKEIVLPTLYLSGQSDELVPPKQMSKLFSFARTKCVLPVMQVYEEGDHNSTWQRAGQQYWDDIMAFMTTTSFMCPQNQA